MTKRAKDLASFSYVGKFIADIQNQVPLSTVKDNKNLTAVKLTARSLFTILYIRRTIDVQLYEDILRHISVLYTYIKQEKK